MGGPKDRCGRVRRVSPSHCRKMCCLSNESTKLIERTADVCLVIHFFFRDSQSLPPALPSDRRWRGTGSVPCTCCRFRRREHCTPERRSCNRRSYPVFREQIVCQCAALCSSWPAPTSSCDEIGHGARVMPHSRSVSHSLYVFGGLGGWGSVDRERPDTGHASHLAHRAPRKARSSESDG